MDRLTCRQTDRWVNNKTAKIQIEGQADRWTTGGWRQKWTARQTNRRHIGRTNEQMTETDGKKNRVINRQTDKIIDRHTARLMVKKRSYKFNQCDMCGCHPPSVVQYCSHCCMQPQKIGCRLPRLPISYSKIFCRMSSSFCRWCSPSCHVCDEHVAPPDIDISTYNDNVVTSPPSNAPPLSPYRHHVGCVIRCIMVTLKI